MVYFLHGVYVKHPVAVRTYQNPSRKIIYVTSKTLSLPPFWLVYSEPHTDLQYLHRAKRVTEGGVSRISYGKLGFLFRVWPGQSFKTGYNFENLCVLKMFRSCLGQLLYHKYSQYYLWLFYRAFLTIPITLFFSYPYMFWSLSTILNIILKHIFFCL